MKAGFLVGPRKIEIQEVPLPNPEPEEVLIKISKVGICGSDVHLFLGHRKIPYPQIIGHEGIGQIVALGQNVKQRKIGEWVAVEPNIPCGNCRFCNLGKGNICPNKRTIGLNSPGCFAEFVCVPENFCWKIPEGMKTEEALLIEPSAVIVHALSLTQAKPGQSIAVIGLGAIGMLLTDLALLLGYKVHVAEINEEKINKAVSLGAISSPKDLDELKILWEKEEVQAVFECGGSAKTVNMATELAPRGSEIVLLGLSEDLAHFQPLKIVREGIKIIPSLIYNHPQDFRQTIELMACGKFLPGKFLGTGYRLEALQEALEVAASGSQIKVWISMQD